MGAAPDTIWETLKVPCPTVRDPKRTQTVRIGRPNYANLGVRERVAREAIEAEFATLPISNTNTLRYFAEVEKLHAEFSCECCGESIEGGLWCAECSVANSRFGVGA